MLVLFSAPLTVLAVCEILMGTKSAYIRNWFGDSGFGEEDTPESQNPEVDHEDGLMISKVKFNDLIKEFPNPLSVCSNRFIVISIFETRIFSHPTRLFCTKCTRYSAELRSWLPK